MQTIDEALNKLKKSKFRSKFHLSDKDKKYRDDTGLEVIRRHAEDFIAQRLAPDNIPNDGKQTPMRGHPVFIAQHACACCCRGCLSKWYRVNPNKQLSPTDQEKIVNLIMTWIEHEYYGE